MAVVLRTDFVGGLGVEWKIIKNDDDVNSRLEWQNYRWSDMVRF